MDAAALFSYRVDSEAASVVAGVDSEVSPEVVADSEAEDRVEAGNSQMIMRCAP